MTKVRVVGTVSDFIDNVPILYSKMKLKCRQRNMFTREFTVVRDKDLLPLLSSLMILALVVQDHLFKSKWN